MPGSAMPDSLSVTLPVNTISFDWHIPPIAQKLKANVNIQRLMRSAICGQNKSLFMNYSQIQCVLCFKAGFNFEE